ncbi:MAG: GNAT family N-acetyltransferase [Actinomycetia bacterium]|nr:GNAT family N-acetyltransferase [Actinomycetes bacterium]MCP4960969.1 GNAT family N-acetyltransferase [Actinomycetes bacterium]
MHQVYDVWFDDLTVRWFHDLLRLRCDVFVVEQECVYPEVDGLDPESRHVWIEIDGEMATALRVIPRSDHIQVGRVVTAPRFRGMGLAGQLMDHVLATGGTVELEAQSYLAHWYQRWGFTVTGPEEIIDGIPHVPMRREA